jgi:16S rRNA processing protein RimM
VQLVIGRIGRAHGVRGEVAVDVRTDDPDRRFAPGAVVETDPPEAGPLTVVRARPHAGRLLVSFAELTDRDTAEAKRGTLLVADSTTSTDSNDPDQYWDHDLVGLAVVDTAGTRIGELIEVVHLPSQDLLVVRRDAEGNDGGVDAGEVLIPFVAAIVPQVDMAGGRIVVDPPPGLLDTGPSASDEPADAD